MKINEKINPFSVKVNKYATYPYAGASLDFNPIHLDNDFAKKVGLEGIILHGLCTMAYVFRGVLGDKDPSKIKKLRVRFKKPVRPEDTLTLDGVVVGIENNLAGIDISMKNMNAEEVISNGFVILELD